MVCVVSWVSSYDSCGVCTFLGRRGGCLEGGGGRGGSSVVQRSARGHGDVLFRMFLFHWQGVKFVFEDTLLHAVFVKYFVCGALLDTICANGMVVVLSKL